MNENRIEERRKDKVAHTNKTPPFLWVRGGLFSELPFLMKRKIAKNLVS
jgi:hypothetical protein